MTASEFVQLRAFARVDGLKLSLLWLASFASYVAGLRSAGYALLAMALTLAIPFYSARLLRRFRDQGLDGVISLGRGWGYVVYQFFYASLIFALAQFVYFNYFDQGAFVTALSQMMGDPESARTVDGLGMGRQMSDTIELLRTMRPIEIVLNILTSNLLAGCLLGLPIAALCQRRERRQA